MKLEDLQVCNLINDSEFYDFQEEIDVIGIKLNNYIRSIGKKVPPNRFSFQQMISSWYSNHNDTQ